MAQMVSPHQTGSKASILSSQGGRKSMDFLGEQLAIHGGVSPPKAITRV